MQQVGNTSQHTNIEEQIIQLLHARNKEAIQLIYANYARVLLGTITRVVGDPATGEDVFQEAMVKIWKNGPAYDSSKGRLFTWMMRICRNQAIDTLRSKGYKSQQKIQSTENIVVSEDSGLSYSFNPDLIGIKEKLDSLDASYREVIEVVYYKGYTHAEAAEALNLPLGTVKSRVRIAIRELRTILGIELS